MLVFTFVNVRQFELCSERGVTNRNFVDVVNSVLLYYTYYGL